MSTALLDPLLAPLNDNSTLVTWIARITGQLEDRVRLRLFREEQDIGCNVREDLKRYGIPSHVWNDRLIEFYRRTDAFLYELVAWNRHPDKLAMRRWIAEFLSHHDVERVLCVGDGLGFDSLYLHRAGLDVTYSDLSEISSQFASALFEFAGANVTMFLDEAGSLQPESFDVVTCLDVLEHVPDPPALIGDLARAIRPGGLLILSAPFWMLTHEYATHLHSNRKYSGRLINMCRPHGLKLYDGRWKWEPLVLVKLQPGAPVPGSRLHRQQLLLFGILLATANVTVFPHSWLTRVYRWFVRSQWSADLTPATAGMIQTNGSNSTPSTQCSSRNA